MVVSVRTRSRHRHNHATPPDGGGACWSTTLDGFSLSISWVYISTGSLVLSDVAPQLPPSCTTAATLVALQPQHPKAGWLTSCCQAPPHAGCAVPVAVVSAA